MKFIRTSLFILTIIFWGCRLPEEKHNETDFSSGIVAIEIYSLKNQVLVNECVSIKLLALNSNGEKSVLADNIIWECSNDNALINENGELCGRKAGPVNLNAKYQDFNVTEVFNVIEPEPYSDIKISEVFYDAQGSDSGKEFIELYNYSESDCDLKGCSLMDGSLSSDPFVFTANMRIRAKDFIIISQDEDIFSDFFGISPDYGVFNFTLNNSGETIILYSPEQEILDIVYIKGGTEDFSAVPGWGSTDQPQSIGGNSVQRNILIEDSDRHSDWYSGLPGPGD